MVQDDAKMFKANQICNLMNEKKKLDNMISNIPQGEDARNQWFAGLLKEIQLCSFDESLRDEIRKEIVRIISQRSNQYEEQIKTLLDQPIIM